MILTDERWVPETSDRSNTRLVKRRLLTGRAEAATFHPFFTGEATPEEAIPALTERVRPLLPFTVMLIGMGEDMHCASIFPDSDNLQAALAPNAPLLLPMRRPGEDEVRVTFTMPVLQAAMSTHLLITGQGKADAVKRARKRDQTEAPVAGVLGDASVHWAE